MSLGKAYVYQGYAHAVEQWTSSLLMHSFEREHKSTLIHSAFFFCVWFWTRSTCVGLLWEVPEEYLASEYVMGVSFLHSCV